MPETVRLTVRQKIAVLIDYNHHGLKSGDSIQNNEEGDSATCISIALPLQKKGINTNNIDFLSIVGWGFCSHPGSPAW